MKRIAFLVTAICLSTAAFAQPDVTSAYSANERGDYAKAAEYIEKAMSNEKAIAKEKTWRYRGNIYMNIAMSEEHKGSYPDALQKATESYMTAMEKDTRGSYKTENELALRNIQILSMNAGIEAYNGEKFDQAAGSFMLSNQVSEHFGVTDTTAIYNTALAYEKSGNVDGAIDAYKKCGDLGYMVPDVYLFIYTLQKTNDDADGAMATLKQARANYPNNAALIIEELNIYLQDGNFEEAEKNLQLAIQNDPNNEVLYFSIGSVYDNLKKREKAEEAYLKSLELKPEYFDANYNLGALYFNQAVEQVNAANEIPPSENKKYQAAIEEANKVFEKGLPYLEKAHEILPEDESTMRSLKDMYIRLSLDDKYEEIKAKLGE